ncbi:MAG: site-specific integrase [Candidatus Bathyarchaeia archaeon]
MAQNKQYINEWLSTYAKQNTRKVFRLGVKQFLNSVYEIDIDNSALESYAAEYIDECRTSNRDWFKDLLKFAANLHKRPPKSARAFMAGVKNWIEFTLDAELTRKQSKLILGRLPKGTRARTEEAELSRENLRKILTHADIKGRALFLLLASSGIRIGEALQLKLNEVDLSSDPPTVTVRGEYTKSGDKYTSFLSSEAKEALQEWLKVREAYLSSALNKGRGLGRIKSIDDQKLFPFSQSIAEQMWRNTIKKAGFVERDAVTNRHKMRVHMLRKWFLSQAKLAAPENIVEAWAGHSGYLDDAYRRYSIDQMREYYKKAEPYLLIGVPKDIAEIQSKFQKDVDQLRDQIADLTRKLTDANAINLQMLTENMQLKTKITDLEKAIGEIRKQIDDLIK